MIEQEQIPDLFWPVTGQWGMRGMFALISTPTHTYLKLDLHKVYIDDESYNSGHGRAYEFYGVDPLKGAVVVVRPDQCQFSNSKSSFS
jgi:phenol 2-monooxygenase